MHRKTVVYLMALGSAVFVAGCGDDNNTPAGPVTETFRATLDGASERPTPRTTTATATANFILRRDTLYWTITLTNATNVTASHIHVGTADVAGGIILPLTPPVSNTSIAGFIARSAFAPPSAPNQALTFDGLLDLLRNGGSYVNVHTTTFPGGEIRGQVVKIT